jgi:hypothetical protein
VRRGPVEGVRRGPVEGVRRGPVEGVRRGPVGGVLQRRGAYKFEFLGGRKYTEEGSDVLCRERRSQPHLAPAELGALAVGRST